MTDKPAAGDMNEAAASPDLRNQMIRRLAVAGGLVAILLGMLAVFDHLSQPAEEQEVRVFTEPVPVAPKKMVTQPVTPVEPVVDEAPVAQEAVPAATVPAEAAVATPPPPEVPAQPAIEPTVAPASPPVARPRVRPVAPASPEIVPEMTSAPPIAPAPPVSPPKAPVPSARVVESTPAAPAAPRLFSGFVLQAGVFTSAQRAEELHAKLTLSGVQSSIETRVQVGPFRTRKEAAEAQEKLRELGIDSILIAPKGGR
ncbi:SPOR domain-containing protein [uncultured Azonexus sp.]|uniref:SPOR domain-containing protein n=1 Tax=uncultured Azonexus sp. TaxID=520307 RepID=UPI00262A30D4|nr:SPOR domain-containing protein [uncultured Azonexus sp.]